jgi:hypothetical protein
MGPVSDREEGLLGSAMAGFEGSGVETLSTAFD